MAIKSAVTTAFGENRELYIRLNNVEVSNHGVKGRALFRGFMDREAYEDGAHYMWEKSVEFISDVTKPLWEQAYAELKLGLDDQVIDC